MVSSKKDSVIESYSKARPLILIKDTLEQRIPDFLGVTYPPPCKISRANFQIIQSSVYVLACQAGFEYTKHPAYHVFNDERFRGHRRSFWQPMLRVGYPIYVISPLFGVMWPGDRFGPYDLVMEDAFFLWKQKQLWRIILEFYEYNKCDCVISYLPNLYDNIVRVEETPWFLFNQDDFLKHMHILLEIARNSQYKAKTLTDEYNDMSTDESRLEHVLRGTPKRC